MDLDGLCEQHHEAIELAIGLTCAHWHVSGPDAEDLANELWLCLLANDGRVLRRSKGASTIRMYLFCVLNRDAGHWIHRQAERRRRELPAGEDCVGLQSGVDCAPDPEAALVESEIRNRRGNAFRAACGKLPDIERRVVSARCAGLPINSIADLIGIIAQGGRESPIPMNGADSSRGLLF